MSDQPAPPVNSSREVEDPSLIPPAPEVSPESIPDPDQRPLDLGAGAS